MDAKELGEVFAMMKETNSELERLRSLNKELVEALDWALIEARHIFKGNYYAKKYAELVAKAKEQG